MTNLTEAQRETLVAVVGSVSVATVAEDLDLSKSAARKRLEKLVELGYLTKEGKPALYTRVDADNEDEETETENTEVENAETETEVEVENAEETETEVEASNNDSEAAAEDNLVDVYINGEYTISVDRAKLKNTILRCNPNATYLRETDDAVYYEVKSGTKG